MGVVLRFNFYLVYVHSNLRLVQQVEAVDYTETNIQWEEWAVADSSDDENEND